MNTMRSDTRHLFDLLVDNELSDADRRELLAQCEAQPDGWRACALAFLEAQDWSNTLGRPRETEPAAVAGAVPDAQPSMPEIAELQRLPSAADKPSPPRRYWTLSSAVGGLAMAASLLLAFGLGLWMNPIRGLLGPAGHDFVIQSPGDSGSGDSVSDDPLSNSAGGTHRPSPASVAHGRPGQLPRNARLVVGGATGNDEVQVPLVDGREADHDWWRRPPASLPDEVRRTLERRGHQVRERRQLLPFDLDDGRRVMVPVDQIDVQPPDEQVYQ